MFLSSRTISFCILLIISSTSYAQNVLDGVYIIEHTPSKEIVVNKANLFYGNSLFYTTQLKSESIDSACDKSISILKKIVHEPLLEIDDCIYFDPSKNHISNLSDENSNGHYFYTGNLCYEKDEHTDPQLTLPYSTRFYIDSSKIEINKGAVEMQVDLTDFPVQKYLQPFHFRKHEITNKEYREFVHWVRDSIAKRIIGEDHLLNEGEENEKINWEIQIDWQDEDLNEALSELFTINDERFWLRKQIDHRKMNYEFWNEQGERDIINIYPDTLCWIHDFADAEAELFSQMCFWHPFYDHHSVVGVSYFQAKAFLDWKTRMHQEKLNGKGVKLKVKYELPSEIQWEIAVTANKLKKSISVYQKNYDEFSDSDWYTNLNLNDASNICDTLRKDSSGVCHLRYRKNVVFKQEWPDNKECQIFDGNLVKGFNSKKPPKFYTMNSVGIWNLEGNVSEWLQESYALNWRPIYEKNQQMMSQVNAPDVLLELAIKNYFDAQNDTTGYLIRGGNWFDRREGKAAYTAKVFKDGQKSFSTVGFRYVVVVTEY